MIKLNAQTANYRKQNILISINSLIDIDVGLMYLIKEQYLDPTVFSQEIFETYSIVDFIKKTYFRTEMNPLYDVAVIEDWKLLDDYYMEFNKEMYNDIYDRSTYTDVISMIYMFIDAGEFDVSILYYRDYSKEQLEKDIEEDKLPKEVKLVDAKTLTGRELDKYDEIYLRSVYELDRLPIDNFTYPKSFYISSFRTNFDADFNIMRTDPLNKLMSESKLNHELSVFSMYNSKNIKPDKTQGEEDQ